MNNNLEDRFHADMLNIYQRAMSEAGYHATRFLHMVGENGGIQAARTLLHANGVSEGYTALWELGRLDLTVEALIVDNPDYHGLFTDDELAICRQRLREYNYKNLQSG
ncbi:hypothetical protein J2T55_000195 [Methylohalomonas lacus]|uniref:Uncharacterized protein n=1 Tax=Methylohalomonas lacus TaxID=398773 RepID=A0AAE3HKP3_9GAMM|nr:hypothetical protein [Methylohalomonas lacus]MCS3902203.1 hypothetical protein [Methylohalomonas lacus]